MPLDATWMDRYKTSKQLSDLMQSRDLYVEAFQGARDDYYTGINAAAQAVVSTSAQSRMSLICTP